MIDKVRIIKIKYFYKNHDEHMATQIQSMYVIFQR